MNTSAKLRYLAYALAAAAGLLAFLYLTPYRQPWNPWYCSQHSGFRSNAWNTPASDYSLCQAKGCRAVRVRDADDPQKFDDDGYFFRCVR